MWDISRLSFLTTYIPHIMSNHSIKNIILIVLLILSYPLVVSAVEDFKATNPEQDVEEEIDIQNPTEKVIEIPLRQQYENLVDEYALQYGVSSRLMKAIITCENNEWNPKQQSNLLYNFTKAELGIFKGEREYSIGLVQINLHYNPNITYEQATDPEFSIELLADWLSKGYHSRWGCYTSGTYKKYM